MNDPDERCRKDCGKGDEYSHRCGLRSVNKKPIEDAELTMRL